MLKLIFVHYLLDYENKKKPPMRFSSFIGGSIIVLGIDKRII